MAGVRPDGAHPAHAAPSALGLAARLQGRTHHPGLQRCHSRLCSAGQPASCTDHQAAHGTAGRVLPDVARLRLPAQEVQGLQGGVASMAGLWHAFVCTAAGTQRDPAAWGRGWLGQAQASELWKLLLCISSCPTTRFSPHQQPGSGFVPLSTSMVSWGLPSTSTLLILSGGCICPL